MPAEIKVERATPEQLKALGVEGWTAWECSPETFEWTYSEDETAYVKEGRVRVRTEHGQELCIGAGDLVSFPRGLSCTWIVEQTIRKLYRFGPP